MSNKLTVIIDKVKELRAVMQEQGKVALKEAFAEFFQSHPEAKAIVWTQYTPYFNDGDACVFSVSDLCLKLNSPPESSEDDYEDEEDYGAYECDTYEWRYSDRRNSLTENEQSILDDFKALQSASSYLEEVFELVFGDHVKVVATPDGFEVEEYDHD